jgi:hypothetical protein
LERWAEIIAVTEITSLKSLIMVNLRALFTIKKYFFAINMASAKDELACLFCNTLNHCIYGETIKLLYYIRIVVVHCKLTVK